MISYDGMGAVKWEMEKLRVGGDDKPVIGRGGEMCSMTQTF